MCDTAFICSPGNLLFSFVARLKSNQESDDPQPSPERYVMGEFGGTSNVVTAHATMDMSECISEGKGEIKV